MREVLAYCDQLDREGLYKLADILEDNVRLAQSQLYRLPLNRTNLETMPRGVQDWKALNLPQSKRINPSQIALKNIPGITSPLQNVRKYIKNPYLNILQGIKGIGKMPIQDISQALSNLPVKTQQTIKNLTTNPEFKQNIINNLIKNPEVMDAVKKGASAATKSGVGIAWSGLKTALGIVAKPLMIYFIIQQLRDMKTPADEIAMVTDILGYIFPVMFLPELIKGFMEFPYIKAIWQPRVEELGYMSMGTSAQEIKNKELSAAMGKGLENLPIETQQIILQSEQQDPQGTQNFRNQVAKSTTNAEQMFNQLVNNFVNIDQAWQQVLNSISNLPYNKEIKSSIGLSVRDLYNRRKKELSNVTGMTAQQVMQQSQPQTKWQQNRTEDFRTAYFGYAKELEQKLKNGISRPQAVQQIQQEVVSSGIHTPEFISWMKKNFY